MAVVYIVLGALGAWFFISFRARKAAVRDSAFTEFAHFIAALDGLLGDPTSSEALDRALAHYRVYSARAADCAYLPSGRGISPERTLMAGFWVEALRDSGLIDAAGRPFTEHPTAARFWEMVWKLGLEADSRGL